NGPDEVAFTEVGILDDDFVVRAQFDRSNVKIPIEVREGNLVDTTVPLRVELVGTRPAGKVTVDVAATIDTNDFRRFSLSTNKLVFDVGEVEKTVTLTIHADTVVEGNAQIFVNVTAEQAIAATSTDDQLAITLLDDDQALLLTPVVPEEALEQPDLRLPITLSADHAPSVNVTVPVTITPISATPGSDFDLTGFPAS